MVDLYNKAGSPGGTEVVKTGELYQDTKVAIVDGEKNDSGDWVKVLQATAAAS